MANASISGLGSGLDTATIVSQLMQLEALPQSRLKTRVSTEEAAVKALQSLNTKIAALATKATEAGGAQTWSSLKATSSLPGLTVTATTAGSPTSFSVTVDKVALSHQVAFSSAVGLDDQSVPTSVLLNPDPNDPAAVPKELTTDGTLRGLVAALNDPANETGVRANAIHVGDGKYQLLVESRETGLASDFSLTGAGGAELLGTARTRAGQDAQVSLGDTGITATSTTNTFADLLPGVTLQIGDASLATKTSQVTVARDAAGVATNVKSMIDAVNSVLTEIGSLTANGANGTAGRLPADTTVRSVANSLTDALYPAGGGSMAQYGVQIDRNGKLTFDEATFAKAYEADPVAVAAAFSAEDGFGARISAAAKKASDAYDGSVSQAIKGRNEGIGRLKESIEAWDLRLELRRTTLTRQFTALDVALSSMNSQSSWLAGQINTLNGQGG